MEHATIQRVAASEFDLLTVARALVGQAEPEAVEPLLRGGRPMPERLGPTAMRLLQQTLRRGLVLELGRRGGWRPAEHLDGQQVVAGRLWQRRAAPALRLSAHAFALCRWLVEQPLPAGKPFVTPTAPALGDQLLLYLACDLIRRCDCADGLCQSKGFTDAPLCWLGFPELLGRGEAARPPAALAGILTGDGATLVEALQQDLAARWIAIESAKRRSANADAVIAAGRAQQAVIEVLCLGAERHGRRDLLGFLLEAAAILLYRRPPAADWAGGLQSKLSLRQRAAVREAATALLRALPAIHRWIEEARGVRFFDDDYDACQLLLRQWEQLGADRYAHAQRIVQQLDRLEGALADGNPHAPESQR